jgi:hypothetical protein
MAPLATSHLAGFLDDKSTLDATSTVVYVYMNRSEKERGDLTNIPKEATVYTLEGRPPSAFVCLVVGKGLNTVTDFVQNSRKE